MRRLVNSTLFSAIAALTLGATGCGGDDSTNTPDAGPQITTDHCEYEPLVATAGTGGTVTAGALSAGAAEAKLDIPVGTALGGYTERAGFLGSSDEIDTREIAASGSFNPSVGVEAAPMVKVVTLNAGGEHVVIAKLDVVFVYEGMRFDVEDRLGPAFAGKVILSASHSHSGWAQFTGHGPLKLGAGQFRQDVYDRFVDQIVATIQASIASERPAKIGFFLDDNFDPTDQITHDRRDVNDELPGGNHKDHHLALVRVDGIDDQAIAIIPVYGAHSTLNGSNNSLASSDAAGAMERVVEESFDHPVVVMHLNSAGGDVTATGHGSLDCSVKPGRAGDPCWDWTTEEGHGRAAVATIMAAWTNAGAAMQSSVPMELVTRSIETGPHPETFAIRDGALAYAAFDGVTAPDRVIYSAPGVLASPIDEFNAPVGAALCETEEAMFPAASIPGDDHLAPYGSCLRMDLGAPVLGQIFDIDFGVQDTEPVCEMTRTTISALRIGDYMIGTLPGELTVLLGDRIRELSPVDDAHTILLGYSQGHVGYMLRPEDWMLGGYEPSVTFWGPLEAEHIGEELAKLMPLAVTPTREDSTIDGTTKVATASTTETFPVDYPAPQAGTVPATLPADVWTHSLPVASAQPDAVVPRVAGMARFVWIGDDPLEKTPRVRLEKQTGPGTFAPVLRTSGRPVDDGDVLLAYTPQPLQRVAGQPQTHYWSVEWQAVPWIGTPGLDSLDDRGGVPLGTYRFHVEGAGWTLDSQPFAVGTGGLEATSTHASTSLTITVKWDAPKGWRLMDMELPSNHGVPVRNQAVTVELFDGIGGLVSSTTASTAADGTITVPDGGVHQAVITDRFGNSTTINY